MDYREHPFLALLVVLAVFGGAIGLAWVVSTLAYYQGGGR